MFCENCGMEINDKQNFCLNCGNKLKVNIMSYKTVAKPPIAYQNKTIYKKVDLCFWLIAVFSIVTVIMLLTGDLLVFKCNYRGNIDEFSIVVIGDNEIDCHCLNSSDEINLKNDLTGLLSITPIFITALIITIIVLSYRGRYSTVIILEVVMLIILGYIQGEASNIWGQTVINKDSGLPDGLQKILQGINHTHYVSGSSGYISSCLFSFSSLCVAIVKPIKNSIELKKAKRKNTAQTY